MNLEQFANILDSDLSIEDMLEVMDSLEGSTPQAQ